MIKIMANGYGHCKGEVKVTDNDNGNNYGHGQFNL